LKKSVKVARQDDIEEGGLKGVEVDGQEILLACVAGQVYAFDAICNHGRAYLEEGELEGYEIICPLHAGGFDIRTGEVTLPPCVEPLKIFPLRIENGEVVIDVDAVAGV